MIVWWRWHCWRRWHMITVRLLWNSIVLLGHSKLLRWRGHRRRWWIIVHLRSLVYILRLRNWRWQWCWRRGHCYGGSYRLCTRGCCVCKYSVAVWLIISKNSFSHASMLFSSLSVLFVCITHIYRFSAKILAIHCLNCSVRAVKVVITNETISLWDSTFRVSHNLGW